MRSLAESQMDVCGRRWRVTHTMKAKVNQSATKWTSCARKTTRMIKNALTKQTLPYTASTRSPGTVNLSYWFRIVSYSHIELTWCYSPRGLNHKQRFLCWFLHRYTKFSSLFNVLGPHGATCSYLESLSFRADFSWFKILRTKEYNSFRVAYSIKSNSHVRDYVVFVYRMTRKLYVS